MLEYLKDIVIALTFAGVCAIGAWLLKTRKQQLLATVTQLVQRAEQTVQGSGLGAEKKAKVVAQLEAMGVTVNDRLSTMIDNVVKYLNAKSGWFADKAGDAAQTALAEVIT